MSPRGYGSLAGFYFCYFAYLGAFAPYFSLYLHDLEYTAAAIGVLMALPQVMRIFAPHLWGYLSDRGGRRVGIVRATGLAGTVCFLGVFAGTEFALLFACIASWSFFWSAALPLMEATTLDHLGERGSDYGRIRLWGSIGFIAAVIGVGWVLDRTGVGTLLWLVGGSMVGILAFCWRIPEAKRERATGSEQPIGQILRRPEVMALIGGCFLMAVAHGPYYTFFSIHLVNHGYNKTMVGWMWALGVIAEIAVFAGLPWLYRSIRLESLLAASFALATLRFVLIGWLVEHSAVLIVAQLLHAASFGTFHAAALALVHRVFRGRNQARGQAVYSSLSFGLGGTLGGLGSGYSWQWLGPGVTFSLAAACALLGLIVVVRWRPRAG